MSSLGDADVVEALVSRANVLLRAQPRRGEQKGRILAVLVPNADGAFGRKMLASAGIQPGESNVRSSMAMAGSKRTTSLTSGTTTSNDNFETSFNAPANPSNLGVLELARRVVRAVEQLEGQAESLIFKQPDAELETTVRAHAFPPKDPRGASPATVELMQYQKENPSAVNEFRKVDPREGGRMHGHTDQAGTDAVVLLNFGSCYFFFDILGKCQAQKTKECWCVGNGGHWATEADAQGRYCATIAGSRSRPLLLRDRLCATCAVGGQGKECEGCASGTVRLCSGDLVILSGCKAFHGVSAVVAEDPLSGASPLPEWAQSKVDAGWRISVQWRLTDWKVEQKRQDKEMTAWNASSAGADDRGGGSGGGDSGASLQVGGSRSFVPFNGGGNRLGGGDGGGGGGGSGGGDSGGAAYDAAAAQMEAQLQAAIRASLQESGGGKRLGGGDGGGGGGGGSGGKENPICLDLSDEDESGEAVGKEQHEKSRKRPLNEVQQQQQQQHQHLRVKPTTTSSSTPSSSRGGGGVSDEVREQRSKMNNMTPQSILSPSTPSSNGVSDEAKERIQRDKQRAL